MRQSGVVQQHVLAAILVAVVVVVVGGILFFVITRRVVEVDSVTLCPVETGATAHLVILIDATDAILPAEIDHLRHYIERLKDRLEVHEKISILLLQPDVSAPVSTVFSLCNPGRGEQFDSLTESQRAHQTTWESRFDEPLVTALDSLASLDQGDQTPLLEALNSISRRFDFSGEVENRRLIIVSDLLHHTTRFSNYRSLPAPESFHETAYYREVRPNLDQVDVEVLYIRRQGLGNLQTREHQDFWRATFRDAGARAFRIEPEMR